MGCSDHMTVVADLPLHKGLWQPSDVLLETSTSLSAQRGGCWCWWWEKSGGGGGTGAQETSVC